MRVHTERFAPVFSYLALANECVALRLGHWAEIAYWQRRLPGPVYAYYWRRWSNRTFFLVNGDEKTARRLREFAKRWQLGGELIEPA